MNDRMSELFTRYPALNVCESSVRKAADILLATYRRGGKILVCGNGGSCADSDHIVGELMKGFLSRRPMTETDRRAFEKKLGEGAAYLTECLQRAIPAISLPAQSAVISAFANDVDADLVYAQLVYGYAKQGDALIGISTSGNSKNVVEAVRVANVLGVSTIGLTGKTESALSGLCECTIRVPETDTFKVQELHLPVYHYLCAWLEQQIFDC